MSASVDEDSKMIFLTRGDSLYLNVEFTDDEEGTPYEPQEGDTVRFALKKNIDDEECLILKDIPISTMVLYLEPSDTKDLEFGVYWYDIELTTVSRDVYTPIGPAKFKLTKEVY